MKIQRTKSVVRQNGINLKDLIDKLGEVKRQKAEIEELENSLKEKLCSAVGNVAGSYEGDAYTFTLSEYETVEYDTVKVLKAFSKEQLAQIVKVTAKLQNFVPPAKIGEFVATTTKGIKVTIRRKKDV